MEILSNRLTMRRKLSTINLVIGLKRNIQQAKMEYS